MDSKRLVIVTVLLALTGPLAALERVAPLPSFVTEAADARLRPCSAARVKAWMFIKVARANVYLHDCQKLSWPFEPPIALRFAYEREVPARGFTESANEMLERNLDAATWSELESAIRSFNEQYRAVEDGDTYYMLRHDGRLTLWLNSEQLAAVDNPALARHYFRIWFGEKPFSDSLREELLTPLERVRGNDD